MSKLSQICLSCNAEGFSGEFLHNARCPYLAKLRRTIRELQTYDFDMDSQDFVDDYKRCFMCDAPALSGEDEDGVLWWSCDGCGGDAWLAEDPGIMDKECSFCDERFVCNYTFCPRCGVGLVRAWNMSPPSCHDDDDDLPVSISDQKTDGIIEEESCAVMEPSSMTVDPTTEQGECTMTKHVFEFVKQLNAAMTVNDPDHFCTCGHDKAMHDGNERCLHWFPYRRQTCPCTQYNPEASEKSDNPSTSYALWPEALCALCGYTKDRHTLSRTGLCPNDSGDQYVPGLRADQDNVDAFEPCCVGYNLGGYGVVCPHCDNTGFRRVPKPAICYCSSFDCANAGRRHPDLANWIQGTDSITVRRDDYVRFDTGPVELYIGGLKQLHNMKAGSVFHILIKGMLLMFGYDKFKGLEFKPQDNPRLHLVNCPDAPAHMQAPRSWQGSLNCNCVFKDPFDEVSIPCAGCDHEEADHAYRDPRFCTAYDFSFPCRCEAFQAPKPSEAKRQYVEERLEAGTMTRTGPEDTWPLCPEIKEIDLNRVRKLVADELVNCLRSLWCKEQPVWVSPARIKKDIDLTHASLCMCGECRPDPNQANPFYPVYIPYIEGRCPDCDQTIYHTYGCGSIVAIKARLKYLYLRKEQYTEAIKKANEATLEDKS